MAECKEMELRVPGKQEYALVIRTALGGDQIGIFVDIVLGPEMDLLQGHS